MVGEGARQIQRKKKKITTLLSLVCFQDYLRVLELCSCVLGN